MTHLRFASRIAAWSACAAFALVWTTASFALIDTDTAVGIWLFDDGGVHEFMETGATLGATR